MNTVKKDLRELQMIWRNYYNLLPVNYYEFDIYAKLINTIKTNDTDFVRDKMVWLEFLECMALAIYNYKDFSDDVYDEDKIYDDADIDCCNRIKKYVKSGGV